ncbi:hypothetical protein GQX71_01175 [Wolbachia endosymbiont of Drosophila melanogaster]|nr:hypothetical protein FRT62_01180 [Wolbachia pipientis]QQL96783.1 hypothetical protein GQX71_01175 [Wolbachia endosymbiont of Drosophila melanogaster]QED00574.1 hypothetical protein FRT63_01175 [Wolbachia pipientis]QED01702.1 hypothetical protein FRT61_01180 [Wolbachia pipientis]QQL97919.1 hypothetical protein GQX70_01170 [Wolbachia endosymbiont of Drosophila melanogaster]
MPVSGHWDDIIGALG